MANAKNLRPRWKKGESGNPAGRPPGKPWHKILAELEEEKKVALRDAAYKSALAGDSAAREWLVKHSREGATSTGIDVDIGTTAFTITISPPDVDTLEGEDEDEDAIALAEAVEILEGEGELVEEDSHEIEALPAPVESPVVPTVPTPIPPLVKAARKPKPKYLTPNEAYHAAMTEAAQIKDGEARHAAELAADRAFQEAMRAAREASIAAEIAARDAARAKTTKPSKQERYLDTAGWV